MDNETLTYITAQIIFLALQLEWSVGVIPAGLHYVLIKIAAGLQQIHLGCKGRRFIQAYA